MKYIWANVFYAQGPVMNRSKSSIPNYAIHLPVPKYPWEFAIYYI